MLLLFWLNLGTGAVETPAKVGGDDVPRRRRFEVQVGNVIHAFETDEAAQAFLASLQAKDSAKAAQVAIRRAMDYDDEEAILLLLN